MISVNLLPPEYRTVEGTPVARFVAVIGGVFLTATAISGWAYVHFAMLAEVQDERARLEEELVQLNALADRSRALDAEFKEYQKRRKTIEEIGKSRLLWSRKLDELADLIHNKGDTKRHLVWLGSIRTGGSSRPGSGGSLGIDGWSGGEYAALSKFNADVKASKFYEDFQAIDPPRGEAVSFKDGRVPADAWKFSARLDLKAPGWREKQ